MGLAADMSLRLRRGEWVEVCSEAEILATLDASGGLDGLPFMPEMRAYCGGRFRVSARADRTVVEQLGVRRMKDTVHLEELRCDGAAHGGCSRGCLIFWKEAWLRRVAAASEVGPTSLLRVTPQPSDSPGHVCQATHLHLATQHRPLLTLEDLRAPANEGVRWRDLLYSVAILAYDILRRRVGGKEWNNFTGPCTETPTVSLGLRPGERVRVRKWSEIGATLDARGWNRGMEFSREMLPYCGRELVVLARVERIFRDQGTKPIAMKNTVLLEGGVYRALNRRVVPRREYMFWRECWLERVDDPARVTARARKPALGPTRLA